MKAMAPPMSPMTARIMRLATTGALVGALVGLPTIYTLAAHSEPAVAVADAGQIEDRPIGDMHDLSPGAIARAHDGMFYANIRVNGQDRRCMVDTGASAMVLDAAEAARMGVTGEEGDVGGLLTAGGSRPAVRTRVETVEIAGRAFHSIPAILVRGGSTRCLVGQDMLARLDTVQIHGDELLLR
jgi:clan AA aspartic protease (TIGR02281 family)